MAIAEIIVPPLEVNVVLKDRVYDALKQAIIETDIYDGTDEPRLDERQLSEQLGVSRTPVREALFRLEQEGFVRILPRRGAFIIRKTKKEILEMITVWAALESMAARLITQTASDKEIASLRCNFVETYDGGQVQAKIDEYSDTNIRFHQALLKMSHCDLFDRMTENLFIHMRSIRKRTIGENDRASRSVIDHLHIIEALEARDTELAERLARDHTLGLARHVEENVNYLD